MLETGRRLVSAIARPIVMAEPNNDEPPYEMNGNVMPFAGMMFRFTAKFMPT